MSLIYIDNFFKKNYSVMIDGLITERESQGIYRVWSP